MANIYVVFQHIGYKRHPSIKNKLIIDEQVKDIVEKIFDMYANGQGSVEIVNFLNTNKYLSPTGYRKQVLYKMRIKQTMIGMKLLYAIC